MNDKNQNHNANRLIIFSIQYIYNLSILLQMENI